MCVAKVQPVPGDRSPLAVLNIQSRLLIVPDLGTQCSHSFIVGQPYGRCSKARHDDSQPVRSLSETAWVSENPACAASSRYCDQRSTMTPCVLTSSHTHGQPWPHEKHTLCPASFGFRTATCSGSGVTVYQYTPVKKKQSRRVWFAHPLISLGMHMRK